MEPFVIGLLYIVVGVTGIVGNLAVAFTFLKSNVVKPPKHILPVYLAVANVFIVSGSFFPGLSILVGRWLFGDVGCQLYGFEGFFSGISAIGFVVALGFERYVINARPHARKSLTTNRMHALAFLVMAVSLFWSTMPFFGWSRYAKEPGGTSCTIDWTAGDANHLTYITSLTTFAFFIPILLVSLFLIMSHGALSNETTSSTGRHEMSEEQLVKIVTYILVTTLLLWSPYAFNCMYSVMMGGDPDPSPFRVMLPSITAKMGTTLIPLIYPAVSFEFRHAMWLVFFSTGSSGSKIN